VTIIQAISAVKTNLGRELDARGLTEGVLLGDWSFQLGEGGAVPLDPTSVVPVDPGAQNLVDPVGGARRLGGVISSGSGAAVAAGSEAGHLVVTGLTAMPMGLARRWLVLSEGPLKLNGCWAVVRWLSATSVEIHNPLAKDGVDLPASGLGWELRQRCVQQPNPRAVTFDGRLLAGDDNGVEFSEVGIFCRVIRAPADPSLEGLSLLYCVAHMPPKVKIPEMVANFHVCVQA
jgi:hypothetical protein